MLAPKVFQPSNDKVQQVELHPVRPWIMSATKSNHVSVWDWRTKQVLWEAQLGGADDELTMDADLARMHIRDLATQPNPSALHPVPGPKREATGPVRNVRFLDTDVAQAQLSLQHYNAYGCCMPPPRAEAITSLQGQRLLVVVCEAKVLVVDLLTKRVMELGKGAFEGKAPTCVAFLFKAGLSSGAPAALSGGWLLDSPVLSFGCSDGIVRCVQLFPARPVMRLVSAHKTPVLTMQAFMLRGMHWEVLAVGHQGGSVAQFEPMSRAPAPSQQVPPRADVKAHEGLLPGMALVPMAEDPEDTRCLLFTAGSDHKLLGQVPGSSKEGAKIKVDPKAGITCLAHSPRGYVASGVHSLLLGTEGGLVLAVHPVTGAVRMVANLAQQIPAGAKKVPKVYCLHVHPNQPQLVAAATNSGTLLMEVEQPPPLSAVALPLAGPAQAHPDPHAIAAGAAFGGAGGSGVTYVTAIGHQVLCVTVAALGAGAAGAGQGLNYPPSQVMGKLVVAGDTPGGRALLSASHDGSYVAVVWTVLRHYTIYRQGAAAWQEVTKGSGAAVAWHSSQDVFAVVEDAAVSGLRPEALATGPQLSRKPSAKESKKAAEKEAEAARQAEAAARAAAMASAGVTIHELRGAARAPGGTPVPLADYGAALVYGGPLLAVVLRRPMEPQQQAELMAGASAPRGMQLFSWDTLARVGPELPEPLALTWDPSASLMALAYSAQVLLVRAQPEVQVVASLPLMGDTCPVGASVSLEWAGRQLYISTPTHMLCAFVNPYMPTLPVCAGVEANGEVPVLVASLAAPASSSAAPAGAGAAAVQEGLLPRPAVRPPGPLSLLGPRDGSLWLVGSLGQPLALALVHPGFQSCSLAASGDLHGAVALCARSVPAEHHDAFAVFLLSMDGLRGASAALQLPGLSLHMELRLRQSLRHWQQAVDAAEALLLGHVRKPPLGQFTSSVVAGAFGGSSRALGEEFVDLSGVSGGAAAKAHVDDLDWTQPLRAATSSTKAAATAANVLQRDTTPPPAPAVVESVLGLLTDLVGVGLHDVARHLAKALLAYARQLGGEQLRLLAGLMAQAGMKQELPAVAHAVVVGADEMPREEAGLLGALLSGHTTLVQEELREGGAHALAALQARAYELSGAQASMTAWKRHLREAAPDGSAGGALGHFEVALAAEA